MHWLWSDVCMQPAAASPEAMEAAAAAAYPPAAGSPVPAAAAPTQAGQQQQQPLWPVQLQQEDQQLLPAQQQPQQRQRQRPLVPALAVGSPTVSALVEPTAAFAADARQQQQQVGAYAWPAVTAFLLVSACISGSSDCTHHGLKEIGCERGSGTQLNVICSHTQLLICTVEDGLCLHSLGFAPLPACCGAAAVW